MVVQHSHQSQDTAVWQKARQGGSGNPKRVSLNVNTQNSNHVCGQATNMLLVR